MKHKYRTLEQDRIQQSPKGISLSTQDMEPILDQEKMFFELTKAVMNDKQIAVFEFGILNETTMKAYDFMRKMLYKQEDEKLLYIYL